MTFRLLTAAALPAAGLYASDPARACGFGEAPGDCGQTAEGDARYMPLRVVAALKAKAREQIKAAAAVFAAAR